MAAAAVSEHLTLSSLNDDVLDMIFEFLDFHSSVEAGMSCRRLRTQAWQCWRRLTQRWLASLPGDAASIPSALSWPSKFHGRAECPVTHSVTCSCRSEENVLGCIATPAGVTYVHVHTFLRDCSKVRRMFHYEVEPKMMPRPRWEHDRWKPVIWFNGALLLDPRTCKCDGVEALFDPSGDLISTQHEPFEDVRDILRVEPWRIPHYQETQPNPAEMRDMFKFRSVRIVSSNGVVDEAEGAADVVTR